jgi:ABC-type antimicrobial peptide transport system permease subunit
MTLLVETTNPDAAPLAGPLRAVIRALDLNQPIYNVRLISSFFEQRAIAMPLTIVQAVGAMGVVGLTLALIGLSGLVGYSVARRTREIGIRMAIGASQQTVMKMVLAEGLVLSIAGILVGGIASVAVARLLTAALIGVGAPNPASFVLVPVMLIALTAAATYLPARRAARVDPLRALRHE